MLSSENLGREKRLVVDLARFIETFSASLSVESKMMLAKELLRWFKPEFDEIKKKDSKGGAP